ncbi:TonB-dependent receptor family protein [Thauera linaloolentis]|uniref:TonB-dependent receptor n=1 Tax=Thauera linaloolentis (strain DSM 12138 / JCM 21573 / CCUG 41526 / CIP 105981 / IAM 15112 / NBRC 102519 / 47Lol) TaxID=1123367 RepID=N6XZE9_THAL4|nr:TonB-dependent receptor [Thauera linaloolentis]ENO87216.1 TonB-dependent receptor [Thauera linaloolentis 47Lol = DSM 12138]MCM8567369.1 TonB-dependent receptor [Thauera linaloolentis]
MFRTSHAPRRPGRQPAPAPARLHLALLCALAAHSAAAADTEKTLDTLVISGSRVEVSPFDVPYSVDGVRLDGNGGQGMRVNVSEVLGSVPGVVVQNRQNYAQDLQISVRGFGARAAFGVRGVKLIADGIPATNPDGQGQAATFNLDAAERIEVLRGPFATVYGNHAGGVIQLFSRDGKGAPRIRGSVYAGEHGTYKIGIGAEGEKNGVGFVLDASRFETNGERRYSAARRDQSFAKITLAPDEDSKLTLLLSSLHQPDTDDPQGLDWATYKRDRNAVDRTPLDFSTRKSIDHLQGGAVYERRFGSGRLQLQAYAGQRSVTQYQSIPIAAQANPRHAGGVIDFEREFHGIGARWIMERDIGAGKLTLTTGLDHDRAEDDRQGYENFAGSTLGVKGRLRRDEINTVTSTDPYVQATWQQGDWDWSLGVRHSNVRFEVDDHYVAGANGDDSGSVRYRKTTPAVGVLWRATPLLNLYASFGTGFETPTLGETAYSSSGAFNLGLEPSTSRQFELGLKAYVGERTRLNLAAFQIDTKNEIVGDGAIGGRNFYKNAGKTLRQGLELAVETELAHNLSARGALTVMRAIYDEAFDTIDDGNRIPGVPRVSAWGELAWKPMAGLSTALEAVHRGAVEVNDTNTDKAAPSYTLLNLRLVAEQQSGPWTFSQTLRLDNVFDREHIASVIVGDRNGRYYEPGPGRNVYGGVQASYRF